MTKKSNHRSKAKAKAKALKPNTSSTASTSNISNISDISSSSNVTTPADLRAFLDAIDMLELSDHKMPILFSGDKKPKEQNGAKNDFYQYVPFTILSYFSEGTLNKGPTDQIKVYDIEGRVVRLDDVSSSYGIKNLKQGLGLKEWTDFQRSLREVEAGSMPIIKNVVESSTTVSISRAALGELKKFLVVLQYMTEKRRQQFVDGVFDEGTKDIIQGHMRHNKITSMKDVWFKNLHWLAKSPPEKIAKDASKLILGRSHHSFTQVIREYKGPIQALELVDSATMLTHFLCIWEAPEGAEFILSDSCQGLFEGNTVEKINNLYILSPKHMLVLVERGYMQSGPLFGKSWFHDYHAFPETVYKNGRVRNPIDFRMEDIFKYRRVVLSKESVYIVNSIVLNARFKFVTFRSNSAMFKSLKFYDQHKIDFFGDSHDYSALKRQLFSEMNRTHSF